MDRLALAGCAAALAVVGWLSWRYLGDQFLTMLLIIALGGVILDNRKLRKRLKEVEQARGDYSAAGPG